MNQNNIAAFDVLNYEKVETNPDDKMFYQPSKGRFITPRELRTKERTVQYLNFEITDEDIARAIKMIQNNISQCLYNTQYGYFFQAPAQSLKAFSNSLKEQALCPEIVSDSKTEPMELDVVSFMSPGISFTGIKNEPCCASSAI